MPRTPAKHTQADIRRAIAANEAAGGKGIVELTPTAIRIIPAHLVRDAVPRPDNDDSAASYEMADANRPVM